MPNKQDVDRDTILTANRMEKLHGKDAHMHASYNAMNNHGKNNIAWKFWTDVCTVLRARNAKKRRQRL